MNVPKTHRYKFNDESEILNLKNEVEVKTQELKIAEEEAQYYRKKYEDLTKSKAFPLTERTGQEILSFLAEKGKSKMDGVTPTEESNTKIGTVRGHEIYVGFGHWANKTAFDEAQVAKKPSLFVISLTYGMWTVEELSNRIVRQQVGINRKTLTPSKKNAISEAFQKWLLHNGWTGQAAATEMRNINSYFGRAIYRSRKLFVGNNDDSNQSVNDNKTSDNNDSDTNITYDE